MLPAGCYATVLLREVCKGQLEEGLDDDSEHIKSR